MSEALPTCRFCRSSLDHTFVDLGSMPLANSYLAPAALNIPEPSYPLHARVCGNCLLVQVDTAVPAEEIFSDYAYFSSYSESWVSHAKNYAGEMISSLDLDNNSLVAEVASNDGYLLQHFKNAGIPVLGIEPAANVADVARQNGIPTETVFFCAESAAQLRRDHGQADLIAANNVLAHVPDLNEFTAGFGELLKPDGVLTFEFPHLLNLIGQVQFDTIYHEHFSYLSLLVVEKILAAHGLKIFDVRELSTHGGSLRVFACHQKCDSHMEGAGLSAVRGKETEAAFDRLDAYTGFELKVRAVKTGLLEFLKDQRSHGKSIAAYGAAAKGNTLLNHCGVSTDLISYVVDRNTVKQGKYLPGSRLPIFAPEKIFETKPDYVLILPWNIRQEVMSQMSDIDQWGGRFVTAVPNLQVHVNSK